MSRFNFDIKRSTQMKFRHRYLAARAGAFFCLLLTAGAMAVTVAAQQPVASIQLDSDRADFVAMRAGQ